MDIGNSVGLNLDLLEMYNKEILENFSSTAIKETCNQKENYLVPLYFKNTLG